LPEWQWIRELKSRKKEHWDSIRYTHVASESLRLCGRLRRQCLDLFIFISTTPWLLATSELTFGLLFPMLEKGLLE
ncbi:hypothetical protein COCCADRAFT_106839, partial [Bipolaris zeicola 26-R-13]